MSRRDERGFTMVELLVVVLILGIIGMLVIPKFVSQPDKAREAVAQADLKTIKSALDMYRIERSDPEYPAADEVGEVLREAGIQWDEKSKNGIRDPWGGPYLYYQTKTEGEAGFVVASSGREGDNWYVTAADDPQKGEPPVSGTGNQSCAEAE